MKSTWGGSQICRKPRWWDPICAGNLDGGDPISAGNLDGEIPYLQKTYMGGGGDPMGGGISYLQET